MIKSGREYKVFALKRRGIKLVFVDLRSLLGGGSLEKACTSLGVREKYAVAKGFVPHSFYTSLDVLNGSTMPPFSDSCFLKMNSKKKMCTEEEYDQLSKRLEGGSSHLDIVVGYCKEDVNVCLLAFLEGIKAYKELFGITVLDSASFTSSSLFFREASVILPFLQGQPSFSSLDNSLALRIVLGGLSGGVCMRMVSRMARGDKMFPSADSETCKKIASLDFR